MRLFVAVTDYDWFLLHAAKPVVEEVNFWKPSPTASFKALSVGELLLFQLHSPRNFIAGGGFFTKFIHLPLRLAWETISGGNGGPIRFDFAIQHRYWQGIIRPRKSEDMPWVQSEAAT